MADPSIVSLGVVAVQVAGAVALSKRFAEPENKGEGEKKDENKKAS